MRAGREHQLAIPRSGKEHGVFVETRTPDGQNAEDKPFNLVVFC